MKSKVQTYDIRDSEEYAEVLELELILRAQLIKKQKIDVNLARGLRDVLLKSQKSIDSWAIDLKPESSEVKGDERIGEAVGGSYADADGQLLHGNALTNAARINVGPAEEGGFGRRRRDDSLASLLSQDLKSKVHGSIAHQQSSLAESQLNDSVKVDSTML